MKKSKSWHELKFSRGDTVPDKIMKIGAEVIMLPMAHDLVFELDGIKYHLTRYVQD